MESEVILVYQSSARKRAPVRGAGFTFIILVVLCALMPAPSHATPILWQSNFGTKVTGFMTDASGGLMPEGLSFSFPYEGLTYTSVTLATTGFVWVSGVNTAQGTVVTSQANALAFFEGSPARIAPAWYDLRPDLSSNAAIYFNDTGSDAIFTFVNVPSETSNSDPATFQLQLLSSGEIIFSYLTLDSASLGSDNGVMIGVTDTANFSPFPFSVASIAAGNSITTSNTGIYDYLNRTDNFNLSGQSIVFVPQSSGGFQSSGFQVFNGVPEPGTLCPTAAVILLSAVIFLRRKRITKY
jgi:hypothetical protein